MDRLRDGVEEDKHLALHPLLAKTLRPDHREPTDVLSSVRPGLISRMTRKRLKMPPRSVREAGVPDYVLEKKATTIAITTSRLGDFAKCTVISGIIDVESMRQFSKTAVNIWKAFAYQPRTTRCLIFLLLLGLTCENITRKSDNVYNQLNQTLGLRVRNHILVNF